jgi:CBS-domain-containing membrane protein
VNLASLFGVGPHVASHREKWLSGIGGGLAASLVVLIGLLATRWMDTPPHSSALPLAVASMAASAVLLFAMPHAPLSQPWPVLGGHLVSALTGVWCALQINSVVISAGVAVAAAITLMYYLRCLHPPGGATALSAVLGSPLIAEMGYRYVLFPVLSGVLTLLVFALLFNAAFAGRRYPAHLAFRQSSSTATAAPIAARTSTARTAAVPTDPTVNAAEQRAAPPPVHSEQPLSQEDFFAAMATHGSFVDISAEGLTELLESARQHARQAAQPLGHLATGRFFSNGALGQAWSVREVVRIDAGDGVTPASLHFRVVAGASEAPSTTCSEDAFRAWARYEVVPVGHLWRKRAAP